MTSEKEILAGRDGIKNGDDKKSKILVGNISHLKGKEEGLGGSNVFTYGHVAQAEIYNRTVWEIAEAAV